MNSNFHKIEIKPTMVNHFIEVRMATVKIIKNNDKWL